jgi:hypothetical protein
VRQKKKQKYFIETSDVLNDVAGCTVPLVLGLIQLGLKHEGQGCRRPSCNRPCVVYADFSDFNATAFTIRFRRCFRAKELKLLMNEPCLPKSENSDYTMHGLMIVHPHAKVKKKKQKMIVRKKHRKIFMESSFDLNDWLHYSEKTQKKCRASSNRSKIIVLDEMHACHRMLHQ